MRPAEVFLRVGVTLVSWIMCYAHTLMLAVLPRTDCSEANAGLWEPTFYLAPLTLLAVWALGFGQSLRDVARWLTVPLMLFTVLAVLGTLPYLTHTTVNALPACALLNPEYAGTVVPGWQRGWAPLQIAVLLGITWRMMQYWRKIPTAGSA